MRTRVIPAQITTVEDKIAGNLNFTQILLLMTPVIWTTIVFGILPPKLHLAMYKLPLVLVVLFVCLILSLRVKGKVVLHWLVILLRYNTRPRYYLFNKNESYLRNLDLPVFEKKQRRFLKKVPVKLEKKIIVPGFAIKDLVRLEGLITNPKYSFSLKSGKKGALNVAFEQIQK